MEIFAEHYKCFAIVSIQKWLFFIVINLKYILSAQGMVGAHSIKL